MTWDGKRGPTWTHEHLRECEAREVMRWPRERRQAYYAKVKAARGEAGLRELVEAVNEQWRLNGELR